MSNLILFAQIIGKLDRCKFKNIVKTHQSDKHQKGYSSWTHLDSMLFCQLAKSQSIREISNGLRSAIGNLNHLGVDKVPSKSTISYQNKHRSYEILKDYYYELQESLGQQVGFRQTKFRIKSKIFLLDSMTISLCLSLFDWARYKTAKGVVKMHTLLDFDGNLPAYIHISNSKTADNKGAYEVPLLKLQIGFTTTSACLTSGTARAFFCHPPQRQPAIPYDKRKRTNPKQAFTPAEGRNN